MKHGGTDHVKGVLNKGTALKPAPYHGGTNLAKGELRAPQPRVYGSHGGTALRMGVLNKRK